MMPIKKASLKSKDAILRGTTLVHSYHNYALNFYLLTQDLRLNGFRVDTEYMNRSLKGQFKQADRYNAKFLIILNGEDLVGGEIQVKDNQTKEVTMVKEAEIDDFLDLNLR